MRVLEPSFVLPQLPTPAVTVKSRNAGSAELNPVVVVVVDVVVEVVEVVEVDVLDVVVVLVELVVVDVVDVVVVVGTSITPMKAPTQLSTRASSAAELPVGAAQSFPGLLSSFAKQPFVGSAPPSYFATALSTQPPKLGSVGLPGVSAFW